jgi:hypothetical protein
LRAFPENTFANTCRGVREGVALGDEAIKGLPILDNPIGRDLRGLMRRAGVMWRLHRMCAEGDLPFAAEMAPMSYGTWHWLEIRSADFIAHPVRTEEPDKFPEDTPNRQDQRLRNQGDLFKKIEDASHIERVYAWLCYKCTNNGAIAHMCWGMPSALKDEWLARVSLMGASAPKAESPEPVKLDPRSVMSFKESIAENISKNDKA